MRVTQDPDRNGWQEFVRAQPSANIYHTPEMFEVFARTRGYAPQVWAVVADDGAVLALHTPVQITLAPGLLHRFTTRAVSYGSVAYAEPHAAAALPLLLETYNHQTQDKILFTELRNQSDLTRVQPLLQAQGYAFEGHLNFLIDLTQSEQALWKNVNHGGRRHIRAAEKKGIVVREPESERDIQDSYRLIQQVYARIGVPLADWSLFRAAWQALAPRGLVRVFRAYLDNLCIGVRFVLTFKDSILDWYAGVHSEYTAHSVNEFLVWHVLQWGQANGFRLFDFGGGGKPNEPYGPREFKRKFGGQEVNFGRNLCVHAPRQLQLSEAGYRLYRSLPRPPLRVRA